MAMSTQAPRKSIGFALGGLAGANAHGIDFLQAVGDTGVEPDIVSCTSGMIYWFGRWLEGKDLRAGGDSGGGAVPVPRDQLVARDDPGPRRRV